MLTTKLRVRFFTSCSVLYSNTRTLTAINLLRLRVGDQPKVCSGVQRNGLFLKNISETTSVVRCKSSGKKAKSSSVKKDEDDEEDEENENADENDDDFDENLGKGVEMKKYKVASLRIDSFLKTASGISRKKIEDYFYDKKIWINGKLLLKKGANVKINDEIDIVKEVSSNNPDFLTVTRFEILNIKNNEDDYCLLVTAKKTKSLLIENYEENHYLRKN